MTEISPSQETAKDTTPLATTVPVVTTPTSTTKIVSETASPSADRLTDRLTDRLQVQTEPDFEVAGAPMVFAPNEPQKLRGVKTPRKLGIPG